MDGRHAPDGRHRRGIHDRRRLGFRIGIGLVSDVQGAVQEREERSTEDSAQLVQEQGDVDSGPGEARRRRVRRAAGVHRAGVGREEELLHAEVHHGSELRRRVH